MEFTRKKQVIPETNDEELRRRLLNWPDCYYRERDPKVRLRLLDEADKEELTPEENVVRRELYEIRYPKNGPVKDTYLRAWMNLRFILTQKSSLFSRGMNPKQVLKELDLIGFDRLGEDASYRALLYQELYHLGMLYASLCTEDKNYTSLIFGLGSLSEEKLALKIGAEFQDIGVRVIELSKVDEKYRLWTDALTAAYCDLFPEYENMVKS